MADKPLPDFRDYISQHVGQGVRYLTGKEAEQARERMKRAFAKVGRVRNG